MALKSWVRGFETEKTGTGLVISLGWTMELESASIQDWKDARCIAIVGCNWYNTVLIIYIPYPVTHSIAVYPPYSIYSIQYTVYSIQYTV